MRVRVLLLSSVFGTAALFAAGCGASHTPKPSESNGKSVEVADPDVGAPLYPAKPDVQIAPAPTTGNDPLVVPDCTVQYEERQQVGSEVDGKIELLAVRDDAIDPKDPNCIYHPRDVNKQVKYRQLKEGDAVKRGQIICFLDDQLVITKMRSAEKQKEAAQAVQKSASEGVALTDQKLELSLKLSKQGGGSQKDVLDDQLTKTRFEENLANALQTIAKAQAEYEEAQVMLGKHRIASTVNGIVRTISRRGGEFVKAGEKILEIQATDVVRLEGHLDVQFAASVQRGATVTVEPALPSAPFKTINLHRNEIAGIAVTPHHGRPLVVTAGADGLGRVWDVTKSGAVHSLPHPVPVRSVACSPAWANKILAVTGADDGKVRVWDVTDPDKLPQDCRELPEAHTAAVGAVAFSPDGRFLASAAGRDVFIWDVAEGKKLYALPAEHRDAVTSLQFTPQCTLVTASKDRSLKVWKLGTGKAGVTKTIDHRAGAVDVLGVTSDGGRVAFDQDKGRIDLVALADRHTVGQVQNLGATAAFSTLAVFSPSNSLLVTAGGEGELKGGLQVWTVPPAGGRGAEAARFFTSGRVGVTTAAFSPVKEHPFLVVGTEKGTVYLWKPPSDARKAFTGKLVNVDYTDPRYATVRVEMDNRELNLPDRSAATVIINPAP